MWKIMRRFSLMALVLPFALTSCGPSDEELFKQARKACEEIDKTDDLELKTIIISDFGINEAFIGSVRMDIKLAGFRRSLDGVDKSITGSSRITDGRRRTCEDILVEARNK